MDVQDSLTINYDPFATCDDNLVIIVLMILLIQI